MSHTDLKTVVCALDFSEGSEAALVRAADLAERLHARLHVLHSDPLFSAGRSGTPRPDAPPSVHDERLQAFVTQTLGGEDAVDVLGPELVVRHGEYAVDAILRYAQEVEADLLVLGTHGRRGFQRLIIGSVAEAVTRLAPCPVLTVPQAASRTAPSPAAPVLVPVDFSEHSKVALRFAAQLADLFSAPIALVHVVQDSEAYPTFYPATASVSARNLPALMELASEHLDQFAADVDDRLNVEVHVRIGQPHREIIALAKEIDAGLIVMATHGLTGVQHALVGSVTERTIRQAPCPVFAVRASGEGTGSARQVHATELSSSS